MIVKQLSFEDSGRHEFSPKHTRYYVCDRDYGDGYRAYGILEYNDGNPQFSYLREPLFELDGFSKACIGVPFSSALTEKWMLGRFVPSKTSPLYTSIAEQDGFLLPVSCSWEYFENHMQWCKNNQLFGKAPLADGLKRMHFFPDVYIERGIMYGTL